MKARVGDLAIARFDPDVVDELAGKKWCEHVCLVTGTGVQGPKSTRYCEFIWWEHGTRNCDIVKGELPPHRLVRVRPRRNFRNSPVLNYWDGTLSSLTLDNVIPV